MFSQVEFEVTTISHCRNVQAISQYKKELFKYLYNVFMASSGVVAKLVPIDEMRYLIFSFLHSDVEAKARC